MKLEINNIAESGGESATLERGPGRFLSRLLGPLRRGWRIVRVKLARLNARACQEADDWAGAGAIWREIIRQDIARAQDWLEYGHCHFHLGRDAEAEAAARRALALRPDMLAAKQQLARVLSNRRHWQQAAAEWRVVLSATPPPSAQAEARCGLADAQWRIGEVAEAVANYERARKLYRRQGLKTEFGIVSMLLARLLLYRDRRADALALMREVSREYTPSDKVFREYYIWAFCKSDPCRYMGELAKSFAGGFLARAPGAHDVYAAQAFASCNRLTEARKIYDSCFEACAANYDFDLLVKTASWIFFRAEEKAARYERVLERAGRMLPDAAPRRIVALQKARLGALYGLGDTARFGAVARQFSERYAEQAAPYLTMHERMRRLEALPSGRSTDALDWGAPKVFVIGLTRTGTTSLHEALQMLGLLSAHFINPLSQELINERDIALFDALSDTPVSWRFEALYRRYPTARFIYTTRPLEAWAASMLKHLYWSHSARDFADFRNSLDQAEEFPHGEALREIYKSLYGGHDTPQAAYLAYDKRVRAFFAAHPEARLLEMNIFAGDGWDKLTRFLGLPTPAAACSPQFPWQNRMVPEPMRDSPPPPPPPGKARAGVTRLKLYERPFYIEPECSGFC